MICPKCGSYLSDNSRFCTRCGTDVKKVIHLAPMHYMVRDRKKTKPKPAKIIKDTTGTGAWPIPRPQPAPPPGQSGQRYGTSQGHPRENRGKWTVGKFMVFLPFILLIVSIVIPAVSSYINNVNNDDGSNWDSDTVTEEYVDEFANSENEFYHGDGVTIDFYVSGYDWKYDGEKNFTEANSGNDVSIIAEGTQQFSSDVPLIDASIDTESYYSDAEAQSSKLIQSVAANMRRLMPEIAGYEIVAGSEKIAVPDYVTEFESGVEDNGGFSSVFPFLLTADYTDSEDTVLGKVMTIATPSNDPISHLDEWKFATLMITFSNPDATENKNFIGDIKQAIILGSNFSYVDDSEEEYTDDSDDEYTYDDGEPA